MLGYTVYFVLKNLQPHMKSGQLDIAAANQIVSILLEELVGDVAEKKEVEAIARSMKVRKSPRSSFQEPFPYYVFFHLHIRKRVVRKRTTRLR